MSRKPLDDFIDAAVRALDLPIEDAWRPAIVASSSSESTCNPKWSSPGLVAPDVMAKFSRGSSRIHFA